MLDGVRGSGNKNKCTCKTDEEGCIHGGSLGPMPQKLKGSKVDGAVRLRAAALRSLSFDSVWQEWPEPAGEDHERVSRG